MHDRSQQHVPTVAPTNLLPHHLAKTDPTHSGDNTRPLPERTTRPTFPSRAPRRSPEGRTQTPSIPQTPAWRAREHPAPRLCRSIRRCPTSCALALPSHSRPCNTGRSAPETLPWPRAAAKNTRSVRVGPPRRRRCRLRTQTAGGVLSSRLARSSGPLGARAEPRTSESP